MLTTIKPKLPQVGQPHHVLLWPDKPAILQLLLLVSATTAHCLRCSTMDVIIQCACCWEQSIEGFVNQLLVQAACHTEDLATPSLHDCRRQNMHLISLLPKGGHNPGQVQVSLVNMRSAIAVLLLCQYAGQTIEQKRSAETCLTVAVYLPTT